MAVEGPLRLIPLIYILVMTGVLAYLWYRKKLSKTLVLAVLVASALFGFLFATIPPWQFQLLLLRDTAGLGGPLAFAAVILGIFLVLTLVFGRIFCASLCPLGALQELASRSPLPKEKPRIKNLLYALRFAAFAVILLAALALSVNVLAFLGVRDLFLLASSGAFLVMVAILLASLVFYRPFCRLVCPYGALLSLAGMASLFKIRRNPSCTECGKCEFACPADEAKRGDLKGECYLCGRCTEVCPVADALSYRRE